MGATERHSRFDNNGRARVAVEALLRSSLALTMQHFTPSGANVEF